jgi:damage-control phosphatase, subfamily I
MKVSSFCAPCKAKRFYEVTCLSTKDEKKRMQCMQAVMKDISRAMAEQDCPSFAGTKQSGIIRKISGNPDPYGKMKKEVILRAKAVYPGLETWVSEGKTDFERFRRAVQVSIAGNALELSAPNYSLNIESLQGEMKKLLKKKINGNLRGLFEKAKKAKGIVFLCDNCGEAVLDKLLIKELAKFAPVKIAVASVPVDEDISLKEAKSVGLNALGKVVGKGRSYGVWKKKSPKEFWETLKSADLVIAKGMANYETLDEYKELFGNRATCLLLVKCPTVEKSLGIKKGSMVAKTL